MTNNSHWEPPAWLEQHILDDGLLASAYEQISNEWRVAIKTAIAAAHFHWGDPVRSQSGGAANALFSMSCASRPARYCAIFTPACFAAAALVTAAAIAPMLAGVDDIYWFMIGAEPHAAQLASLELCGIENIFLVNEQKAQQTAAALPPCPVLLLDVPEQQLALPPVCRFTRLNGKPQVYLPEARLYRKELLQFALGGVPITMDSKGKTVWDAVYSARDNSIPAKLRIGPGLECFWLFPGLRRDFFLEQNYSLDMMP